MKKIKKVMFLLVLSVVLVFVTACGTDYKPILNEVLDSLTVENKNNIKDDIELPSLIDEVVITWSSSNTSVISDAGEVTRPTEEDVEVTLTATLKIGKLKETKVIIVTVIGIESEVFTVTFDYEGYDEVSVKYGNKLTKPVDPVKKGHEFLGWLFDNEYYDFTLPVTQDLTLVANWRELTEEELVLNFLQDSNFKSVLQTGLTLEATAVIGDFTTPYDDSSLLKMGMRINGIKVDLKGYVDIESLFVYLEVNLLFDSIDAVRYTSETELTTVTNGLYKQGRLTQVIALNSNKLYASFNSSVGDDEQTISEILSNFEMFLPEEYKEALEDLKPLLQEYKEYRTLDLTEQDLKGLTYLIELGFDALEGLDEELILESDFDLVVVDDTLQISGTEILPLEIVLQKELDNSFKSLEADLSIEEYVLNLTALGTLPEQLPDLLDYQEVEKLRLEYLLEDILEGADLDDILDMYL